jgi:hypothetical protein
MREQDQTEYIARLRDETELIPKIPFQKFTDMIEPGPAFLRGQYPPPETGPWPPVDPPFLPGSIYGHRTRRRRGSHPDLLLWSLVVAGVVCLGILGFAMFVPSLTAPATPPVPTVTTRPAPKAS